MKYGTSKTVSNYSSSEFLMKSCKIRQKLTLSIHPNLDLVKLDLVNNSI